MDKMLIRANDQTVLAGKCFFAETWFQRLRGMIGRRFTATPFDAMVFEHCNAVHCCWMSEAVDVLFVTDKLEVVKVCSKIKPWRFAVGGKRTEITVELPAGTLENCGIKVGDILEFKPL